MYIEDGSNEDYGAFDLKSFCHYLADHILCEKDKKSLSEILKNSIIMHSPPLDNIYAWGWLGDQLPKGIIWQDEDRKFRTAEAIKSIGNNYNNIIDHYHGIHACGICGYQGFEGSIKIKHNDLIFCCPNGVEHYIEAHNYKPDKIVIDAICHGKIMNQGELNKLGYQLYKDGIAIQMGIIKDRMLKEKIENQKFVKARKEYLESLTQQQRNLINGSLDGTFDFIPID